MMNLRRAMLLTAVCGTLAGCGTDPEPVPSPEQSTSRPPQVAPDGVTDVVRPEDLRERRQVPHPPQIAPDGVSDAVPVEPPAR